MKRICRIVLNVFTMIMPFAAWIMMFKGGPGVLSSRGFYSLKYFTVLSNLFEGSASLLWLLGLMLHVSDRTRHRAEVLKFTSGLCVFLTFATVMLFLGPLFGYASMFTGANFWLHLVVPLAAIAEMLLLMDERFSSKENAAAIIPIVIYGTCYLANILVNGTKDEAGWNDFYGFCTWGVPVGVLIFAGICAVVYMAGSAVRKVIALKGRDS